jgi:hypothetical protein
MSVGTAPLHSAYAQAGFRRWSVAEYHRFIELGILNEDDRVELLEGNVVNKMSINPRHAAAVVSLSELLIQSGIIGWHVRAQQPVTLVDSEPEPDLVLARGTWRTYTKRHPVTSDLGLIVEVSDTSLSIDRTDKGRIYAAAGIACYWVVNVVDQQIEVYTSPGNAGSAAAYASRTDYKIGDSIPLVLDGTQVATFSVAEIVG